MAAHAWFEDRAPPCTLPVYVDDAISRLMPLHFTATEATFSYFLRGDARVHRIAAYNARFAKPPRSASKLLHFTATVRASQAVLGSFVDSAAAVVDRRRSRASCGPTR